MKFTGVLTIRRKVRSIVILNCFSGNDWQSKMGVVKIHFPDMNSDIFSSVRFMIPSVIFTLVLLVTFIFTIVVIFRQKRYTEIKNDFINNMTHELENSYCQYQSGGSDAQ